MGLIKWDQSLSVGVKEIDLQHQKLIDMVNQLHQAMSSGQGKELLSRLLAALVNYTKVHFQTEERLMQKASYPHYAEHKKEHDTLTAKAVDLKNRFDTGQNMITLQVMNFLSDWLKHHILGTDKKYTPFLAPTAQPAGV